MRKQILMKRMARLTAKKQSLVERCNASTEAAEVRSLTEQLEDINAEMAETQEEIDAIEAEEKRAKEIEEKRAANPIPAEAVKVNGNVVGSFKAAEERSEEMTSSMEYREAFKAYVQRGIPMPERFVKRNGDAASTSDTGAAIPMTVVNEVINTVRKRYGNLYSKVRKMNVPGGVKIPVGSLEASFKWVSESTVSPRQKPGALDSIVFGYNVAEIRIAQTFLSQLLTLSAFEAELTKVIAVAYLKAMDTGIMLGSGDGAMTGILNDARVTNTITLTSAQISDWTKWRKNFFAQIPLGYRAGEFVFAASTVDAYLETMQDANGNPIFRQATGLEVNDGDAANPNGRFFGRELSMVEPDIITDFDTAAQGDVIGLFWQPDQYAINENLGFTMRRYFDEGTNEWVDKALTVVDGKVLNPTGFYKILKG